MHRNLPILALHAALGLLALVLLATPDARGATHTDAVLGRLIRGRGVSVDRPRPVTDAELRHYARFVALDLQADPPRVRVWMRLAPEGHAAVQALGLRLLGRVGNLASASVPLPRLAALAQAPGVLSLQAAHRLRAELDVSLPAIGANLGQEIYNARGAGAVVGIVDDGIDITHQDFRNENGSTRIKFLWNQTPNCGNPAPPGFGYGCLYTEAQINNALAGMGSVSATDLQGHGTHVTGVAAGNGRQTGNGQPAGTYVGMAPEADIIYVKNTEDLVSCAQCDLGDALDFIDEKALELGKPWAANVSLGQDFGGHDASDPHEACIDLLTGPGIPGKVVIKSAGNNRGRPIHISGTVERNRSNDHTFTIPSYTPNALDDVHIFNLWYHNLDDLTLRVTSPGGFSVQSRTGDGQNGVSTADGVFFIDDTDSPNPLGTRSFWVQLDDQLGTPPASGTWTLRVTGNSVSGGGGDYDAWIWFSDLGGLTAEWDNPDLTKLVTVPGTSFNVTTVGAYVTRTHWTDITGEDQSWPGTIGSLASFSSPGPTRDDRQKPEIGAPGQVIVSSLAAGILPLSRFIVQDDEHWVLSGTSFSAPHVTGLYAQMLGLNPDLDAIQLRTMVQETAGADGFTGGVPNNDWGAGKVDAKAALDMVVKPVTSLHWTTTSNYMWDDIAPLATAYNVYRARVSQLDGTFYGNCRASGLVTPSVNESLQPPFGDGFFYLITGVKDGIEGLRGFQSNGSLRNSLNVCP